MIVARFAWALFVACAAGTAVAQAWPSSADVATVREALRSPTEVALLYRTHEDRLEGAIVTRGGVERETIPGDLATWRRRIERFERLLQVSGFGWDASTAARALYDALVRPLVERAKIVDPTYLLVVPAGPLRRLEFAALAAREETRTWLGFLSAVSYAPDVDAVRRMLDRPVTNPDRLPPIAAIARDADDAFATRVTAAGAPTSAVLAAGDGPAVLGDALAQLAPSFVHADVPFDGRLAVDGGTLGPDTRELDPDLLIAADVATSIDPIGAGSPWLSAGTRVVLTTRWPIRPQARHAFVSRFLHYLRDGEEPAAALLQTRRDFSRSPGVGGPSTWAAFALVGDGHGRWTLAKPLGWFSLWWGVGLVASLVFGYRVVRVLAARERDP